MALTSEQEDELWELCGKGEPGPRIARSLRSNASTVNRHLAKHGGVRPAPRRRGRQQLTIEQREEVTRGIAAGLSSRAIAALIGRAPSSVSREIARNGGRDAYRATVADTAAWERARRPKMSRLASRPELLKIVRDRLESDWSPEQIAHWLRREHPRDPLFTGAGMARTGDLYLNGQDPAQPLLAPAVLADLTGFPPILLQVGTNELLLDDSVRLANRARDANVDVILDAVANVPHVFPAFIGLIDEADEAIERAALFIRQRLRTR